MSYLLDTHTFLWFINDDPSLSATAKQLIERTEDTVFLSAASVWEMAIKISLRRLVVPMPFEDFIRRQFHQNNITMLGIQVAHTGRVARLPFHHRDPFDRLIIAQSLTDQLSIIGKDAIFDAYGVQRLW